jgi:vacuolar-type H+-ATPase subunit C/Vma6
MAAKERQTILFVADQPEQYGFRLVVENAGYAMSFRNTLVSGLQFLIAQQADAVVIDAAVEGGFSISREVTRELAGMKVAELSARLANTPHGAAATEIAAEWTRGGSAAVVEDVLSRHRFVLLRDALAMRLLSPVLVAWYLTLKETEARTVRLLLKAKFDELPEERVRESLVPLW